MKETVSLKLMLWITMKTADIVFGRLSCVFLEEM